MKHSETAIVGLYAISDKVGDLKRSVISTEKTLFMLDGGWRVATRSNIAQQRVVVTLTLHKTIFHIAISTTYYLCDRMT